MDFVYQVVLQQELQDPLIVLDQRTKGKGLKDKGIAVTTVCPGFIRTGVPDHVILKGQHRKEYVWFSISDSLPLISTSAENVARQTMAAFRRNNEIPVAEADGTRSDGQVETDGNRVNEQVVDQPRLLG